MRIEYRNHSLVGTRAPMDNGVSVDLDFENICGTPHTMNTPADVGDEAVHLCGGGKGALCSIFSLCP